MSTWHLASFWGITTGGDPDSGDGAFNAGHLNDVLRLDEAPFPVVLVASETSGVWLVNLTGGVALALSDRWVFPNLNSLAHGIHGSRHVYAGGDALYETDTRGFAPLFNWRQIPLVDADGNDLGASGVIDIAVIAERRKLVLACGEGILWADIPPPGGSYVFRRAPIMPAGAYSGVTQGPEGTVVVAAWGSDNFNHFGLFYGSWSGPDLLFSRSSIFGNVNPAMMLRTSIDSCRQDRSVMYALAGTLYRDAKGNVINDTIYRVLRSNDGGKNWRVTGKKVLNRSDPLFGDPTKNLPGNQQDWNNCITIAADPRRVALGWRGGYFVSNDAGSTWTMTSADPPHLHSDLHALAFDQFDGTQNTLYVCSDGGLAVTTDLGATHSSQANRQLSNLQIYQVATSYQDAGVTAISLQDNGDNFTAIYPNPDPWQDLDGGDGVSVTSIRTGQLLYRNNTLTQSGVEFGNRIRAANWNSGKRRFDNVKLFASAPLSQGVVPLDGTNDGLPFPSIIEIVNSPAFKNRAGEPMLAIAATDDHLWGLFAPASGKLHWTAIATIPATRDKSGKLTEHISAIASPDGKALLVGTDTGRLFRLNAPAFVAVDHTPTPTPGAITRFVAHSATNAFATTGGQQLWKLTGTTWKPTAVPAGAQGDFTAFDTDWTSNPKALFLGTDNRVYGSTDNAKTWNDISAGLPETPHCRDLQFVTERSGLHQLYLATYGRSVFRRILNADHAEPREVILDGHMDLVDRVAIGHDQWAHPHFHNIVPLGPDHPAEHIEIVEDDGDEVQVVLDLDFQWFLNGTVEIVHHTKLISKDEDNDIEDTHTGTVTLAPGASQTIIFDLASDELWPDRAHIEFTLQN